MPTAARCIGRYMLLEPVGRGAMGSVYRAEDPAIHRTVAIKILDTASGLTPRQIGLARARFMREAEAAGRIDHPNITRVFDLGEDDASGEMYIVMEFVSGPSLETMLDGSALDLDRGLGFIGQIVSGLDAAHARGIIHRDIKASNILVTEEGTAKIADFGITHIASSTLTQDMTELGTPAYMSPEQVSGKVVDHRSDLFSLGVLAYEILAGRKPFEGNDVISIAHAIAYDTPVPISVANPELPRSFDHVFARILAKDPAGRFASGQEFHEALVACLTAVEPAGHSAAPAPVTGKPRTAAWGLVGLAVLAMAVYVLVPSENPNTTPPAMPSPPAAAASAPPKRVVHPAAVASTPSKHAVSSAAKSRALKEPAPGPSVKQAPGAPSSRQVVEKPSSRPPVAKSVPIPVPVAAPAPTADVTIKFAHRLRQGTLVVSLDGEPIFDEKFSKSRLALVQTTVWDPLHAPAGWHTLRARVDGDNGKSYVSEPLGIELPAGQAVGLRVTLKGDRVTVAQSADEADPKR